MIHHSSPSFWSAYNALPISVQKVADQNYELLKDNPKHPSLHLKKIKRFWSVRVGIHYRALADYYRIAIISFQRTDNQMMDVHNCFGCPVMFVHMDRESLAKKTAKLSLPVMQALVI